MSELNTKLNLEHQFYKKIMLTLIDRRDYKDKKAKRYRIFDTNKNVWIPNKFLQENGTIKKKANLSFIFNTLDMPLIIEFCKDFKGCDDLQTRFFHNIDNEYGINTNKHKNYKYRIVKD